MILQVTSQPTNQLPLGWICSLRCWPFSYRSCQSFHAGAAASGRTWGPKTGFLGWILDVTSIYIISIRLIYYLHIYIYIWYLKNSPWIYQSWMYLQKNSTSFFQSSFSFSSWSSNLYHPCWTQLDPSNKVQIVNSTWMSCVVWSAVQIAGGYGKKGGSGKILWATPGFCFQKCFFFFGWELMLISVKERYDRYDDSELNFDHIFCGTGSCTTQRHLEVVDDAG